MPKPPEDEFLAEALESAREGYGSVRVKSRSESEKHDFGRDDRHKENIQILVAVGVLGAYFTISQDGLPGGAIVEWMGRLILFTNSVFLLYKLTINSRNPLTDWKGLRKYDGYFSLLYLVNIWLIAAGLGLLVVVRTLGLSIDNIQNLVIPLVMTTTIFLLIAAMIFITRREYHIIEQKQSQVLSDLDNILSIFVDEGLIDENKKNSIYERYQDVIEQDRQISWQRYVIRLLASDNASPLRLKHGNLNLLQDVFRRIENRANNNVVENQDLEIIETILENAEIG